MKPAVVANDITPAPPTPPSTAAVIEAPVISPTTGTNANKIAISNANPINMSRVATC